MNEELFYPEEVPQPPVPMPGQKSDEVFGQMMVQKKIENLISQINADQLVVEIEYRLKGWRKNEYTGSWELSSKIEKEVSDELLSDVISLLSAFLTNNTTLSNFQDIEINRIMKVIIRKVIDMIRMNSEEYGLAGDYGERDRVLLIICHSIFSTLKRGQNGLEAKRLLESLNIKENMVTQGKSPLEKMQFWK